MTFRERVEAQFERFGYFIARRRWLVIPLMLAFAFSLSSQAPTITIDTSAESFLRDNDPAKLLFDDFRDQFGRGEVMIAAIRTTDALSPDFLEKLAAFHRDLEDEVPHLEEVRSLINARVTRGEADELIVEDLLEEWPESAASWERVREYVLANPLYKNLLISENATLTMVTIETTAYSNEGIEDDALAENFAGEPSDAEETFLSGAENREAVEAVARTIERYQAENFDILLTGSPVLQAELAGAIQRNLARFVGGMVLVILILLFVVFRRISGALLPLVVVAPSVSGAIGSMAIAGHFLSAPTQILPSLLLAVGVGAAVHILTIFYQYYDRGESREDAIAHAMGHSGLAVCMTSLTTAGGLLSFATASLAPVATLGIFAPLGILLGLIYCLVLLPALVAALPLRRRPRHTDENREIDAPTPLEKGLVAVGDFSIRHAKAAVLMTFLVVAVSLVGISKIQFGHDIMSWLPESHSIRRATAIFDSEMRGSMTVEIMADTGRENGVQNFAFLNSLDSLERKLTSPSGSNADAKLSVGKTISLAGIVKEINRALNENSADFYSIPGDPQLIAQELLLFENSGSDDLEKMVDSQFSIARFSLRVPYQDPMSYVPFLEATTESFRRELGSDVEIRATGFLGVMSTTIKAVISSMVSSYVLTLVIITPLMVFLIGSLRTGLASMIPNLAPILITLGFMGWMGIAMDVFSLMIGGIAIGLAVDDTIHYMHNFQRYFLRHGDIRRANSETLRTTGQALLVTSIVLTAGFFVLTFSEMSNLYYFGLLTAMTVANAFMIDVLVSPALMALAHRNRKKTS